MQKRGGETVPQMLPPGEGLAAVQDAEERLAQAISRYWAFKAERLPDFGEGIGGGMSFRRRELSGSVLRPRDVDTGGIAGEPGWIVRQAPKPAKASWWLAGAALNTEDFDLNEDGTITIKKPFAVD